MKRTEQKKHTHRSHGYGRLLLALLLVLAMVLPMSGLAFATESVRQVSDFEGLELLLVDPDVSVIEICDSIVVPEAAAGDDGYFHIPAGITIIGDAGSIGALSVEGDILLESGATVSGLELVADNVETEDNVSITDCRISTDGISVNSSSITDCDITVTDGIYLEGENISITGGKICLKFGSAIHIKTPNAEVRDVEIEKKLFDNDNATAGTAAGAVFNLTDDGAYSTIKNNKILVPDDNNYSAFHLTLKGITNNSALEPLDLFENESSIVDDGYYKHTICFNLNSTDNTLKKDRFEAFFDQLMKELISKVTAPSMLNEGQMTSTYTISTRIDNQLPPPPPPVSEPEYVFSCNEYDKLPCNDIHYEDWDNSLTAAEFEEWLAAEVTKDGRSIDFTLSHDYDAAIFNTLGEHEIHVTAKAGSKTFTETVVLEIYDPVGPVITVPTPIVYVTPGEKPESVAALIAKSGATALDNFDGDVEPYGDFDDFTLDTIDWNVAGRYAITLHAEDNSGNPEQEKKTITVIVEKGNTVERDDGNIIVLDDDGVPLGDWVQSDDGEWVYIPSEEVPLGDLPHTGTTIAFPVLLIGLLLLTSGIWMNKKKAKAE